VAITGVHALLYTPESEALREILRDAFELPFVEAHDPPDGWQIYALPPAELGIHPSEGSTQHQLSLICDDLAATMDELRVKGVEFRGEPWEEPWGLVTTMVLPGGVEMLLYEPRHPTAI
jgi:hypothetical protein